MTTAALSTPRSARSLPIAMIVGSCVSLQFGSVFAMMLFPQVGSWGVTTMRLGIAALVLAAFVRPAVRAWKAHQWRAVLLFGLAFAGMNGTFYAALSRIPIGPAVTIEFLGPLVLSAIMSRRRIELLCAAIALLGVSLFGLDDLHGSLHLDGVGVIWALVAGVFWAGYIIASKRTGEVIDGHGGLVMALGIGSLALLPFGAPGVGRVVAHPHLVGPVLGCALLSSVVPYTLELSALRMLPQSVFGVLLSLEPAVAAVAGLLLLHQGITPLSIVAIVLVVGASTTSTLLGTPGPQPE